MGGISAEGPTCQPRISRISSRVTISALHPPQRPGQLGAQVGEGPLDPAGAADQDMVGAGNATNRQQLAGKRAQPALHSVAHHRVADLLGDGEADTDAAVAIVPLADEQDEAAARRPPPRVRRQEVRTAGKRSYAGAADGGG